MVQADERVCKKEALALAASNGLGLELLHQVPASEAFARNHSAFGSFVPTDGLAGLPIDIAHESRVRVSALLDSPQLISGPRIINVFFRMLVFVGV